MGVLRVAFLVGGGLVDAGVEGLPEVEVPAVGRAVFVWLCWGGQALSFGEVSRGVCVIVG